MYFLKHDLKYVDAGGRYGKIKFLKKIENQRKVYFTGKYLKKSFPYIKKVIIMGK